MAELTPFLVDSKTAAKICGCGLTLFKRLVLTGRTPSPIYLTSGKVVFSVYLLEKWAKNDCPSRDSEQWQKIIEREQNEKQVNKKTDS